MQIITTKKGEQIKVCDCHYELVAGHVWYVDPDGYVMRGQHVSGTTKTVTVRMHRLITGALPGQLVDHRHGDRLDNRCSELRICTASENQWNRARVAKGASGYKGVTWDKNAQKWKVQLRAAYRKYNLGLFTDVVEAARAYDAAALKYHGEFAWLNFPDDACR